MEEQFICNKCKEPKTYEEMGKRKERKRGVKSECLACIREYRKQPHVRAQTAKHQREYLARNPEARKRANEYCRKWYARPGTKHAQKLYRYNISSEVFDALLVLQNYACDICKRPFGDVKPFVDHDHRCCAGYGSCGMCVRGLLCPSCNRVLGIFDDNAEQLREAAKYVEYPRIEVL